MSDSEDGPVQQLETVEDPGGSKRYSYAYITALFAVAVGGLAAAVYFGYIDPSVEVQMSVDLGWLVEYTVAGLVVLFFLWTFAQVANIVGMGFIAGVVGAIARIADNYELPERREADDD